MRWIETNNKSKYNNHSIIAISETGLLKLANGEVIESNYRDNVHINGKVYRIYKLIADNFLITVHRPDQTVIDHITHEPQSMNINDVRNLRYCTNKENHNFDEAKLNNSKAKKGKVSLKKDNGYSLFGKIYKDYYRYSKSANPSQYDRERMYFKRHHKLKGYLNE